MLDNGAFSVWKRGIQIDWQTWADWAEPWLDHRTTWAVLPDSIEGDHIDNDRLLDQWAGVCGNQGAPVWHLHEPIDRLVRLCGDYDRVCFGSSGTYATIGTPAWHRRVTQAFDAIADSDGSVPWIHMLRGMSLAGTHYPFSSLDSTDIARNHHLPHNTALNLANRWDGIQNPARWARVDQLEMDIA